MYANPGGFMHRYAVSGRRCFWASPVLVLEHPGTLQNLVLRILACNVVHPMNFVAGVQQTLTQVARCPAVTGELVAWRLARHPAARCPAETGELVALISWPPPRAGLGPCSKTQSVPKQDAGNISGVLPARDGRMSTDSLGCYCSSRLAALGLPPGLAVC